MLIGGEVIQIDRDIDFQRVAASKSKKIKGMYSMMRNNFNNTGISDDYNMGNSLLSRQINTSTWQRGQAELSLSTNGEGLAFQDDEEAEASSVFD